MILGSHSPAHRDMTRDQYLLFLLLPPLMLGLVAGASKFGSAQFDNRLVHFAFSLASIVPDWLSLELGSVLAAIALRPWRLPLWVALVLGTAFAALAHAPLTLLRDPLFEPYLQPGASLFPSWPWNFQDGRYAMESALALLGRLLFWLPFNFAVVHLLGFRRLGHDHFFHVGLAVIDSVQALASPGLDSKPSLVLLLRRLPPGVGRDILCLKAQEHYTEVVTSQGSALVYMRFSDAVALAATGIDGVQIHRSYWVAYTAMAGFDRTDGRIFTRLINGETLPVSRTYQARVQGLTAT
jgi:LytTr DNA-binding domain